MKAPLLVSCEWLAERLADPKIRFVDVRWYLLNPHQGEVEYVRGHLPGAVYMSIDRDLAKPAYHGPGRHPLPSAEEFAAVASRAGIGSDTHVIAYDAQGGATAARLWWLLRYFGHNLVSLLDGGIARWVAEGRALDSNIPQYSPAEFKPQARSHWVIDQEQVDALRDDPSVLILDSRIPDRFEGKSEPMDARAGHIPSAKNTPVAANLRAPDDTRFREPEQLRAYYSQLGAERADKIIAYCGSSVNACQNIFSLELAGFGNSVLYEGSWSDWSRNPDLPAATGTG